MTFAAYLADKLILAGIPIVTVVHAEAGLEVVYAAEATQGQQAQGELLRAAVDMSPAGARYIERHYAKQLYARKTHDGRLLRALARVCYASLEKKPKDLAEFEAMVLAEVDRED